MLGKTRTGTDFFTTQAVFSNDRFVEVLDGYYARCADDGIPTATIFASFSPVSQPYDLEFLRWLGARTVWRPPLSIWPWRTGGRSGRLRTAPIA